MKISAEVKIILINLPRTFVRLLERLVVVESHDCLLDDSDDE